MSKCPVHDLEFRFVPSGISQRTGKSYKAFFVCPEVGCKEKPVELAKDEPIDQAIAQSPQAKDIPNAQTENEKRSYRIERQHSQEMAIRFLDLWQSLQPSQSFEIDEAELWNRVIELTDKFIKDLEKK